MGATAIGAGRSLLHQIESVPVPAEILHLARGQLESGAELAVLEEDVRIAEAGCVEVLPLPLLGEDALHALDEADLFENPYLAVARRDRYAVSLADLLGADLPKVAPVLSTGAPDDSFSPGLPGRQEFARAEGCGFCRLTA